MINEEHLDDVALSSCLDEADEPTGRVERRSHVESCDECGSRLRQLATVRRRVGTLPPVASGARASGGGRRAGPVGSIDTAIRAALDAEPGAAALDLASPSQAGRSEGDEGGEDRRDSTNAPESQALPGARRQRRAARVLIPAAVAAGIVAAIGLVGVLHDRGGGSSATSSASRGAASSPSRPVSGQPAAEGSSSTLVAPGVPDLGTVAGPEALRRDVGVVLKGRQGATTTLRPDCSLAAEAAAPGRGRPVGNATLRYRATPADAYVFATRANGASSPVVVVVSRSTCRELATVALSK